MVSIVFIERSGTERVVDVELGLSLMDGGRRDDIPGIDAVCGGACSCATCHVYVDEIWFKKLPPASAAEVEMLELAVDPLPTSRLSCQIRVDETLEGLVVRIPA